MTEQTQRGERPTVHTTIDEMREAVAAARRRGDRVVVVPTMGALHAGHRELARRAGEHGDFVVVSIFVNPLQFGPAEDLDRYPRTLDADLDALTGIAHAVFAPSVEQMYPDGPSSTRVSAGPVAALYEGAARPGHFDGMLTVVAKLFNIVQPDVAVFGRKDAQQVFLVERMVRDLNLPLRRVAVVDTVREPDGLALSSRNRFLDPDERRAAVALSAGLAAASAAAESTAAESTGTGPAGARGAQAALAAAAAVIEAEPAVKLDYLVVVDPATFVTVGAQHHGAALMLVAARVGTTRLIDNARLDFL